MAHKYCKMKKEQMMTLAIHLFLLADKDVSCAERCSGVDLCGDADTGAFPAPGHSAIAMEVSGMWSRVMREQTRPCWGTYSGQPSHAEQLQLPGVNRLWMHRAAAQH